MANDANNPNASPPVIGPREDYRFAEEPVAQRAQVAVLETPAVAADLPAPNKIDPGLEQLKVAVEGQMARNAIAPMMSCPSSSSCTSCGTSATPVTTR